MAIFSSLRGFFNRHRNKFFVGGVIVAGSIFLTKYAQKKLIEWQERQAREFFETTRKLHHFESTERTCNQTILNLVATLNESLSRTTDTEKVIADIRTDGRNVELWNKLKLLIFTKASIFVYSSVLLVITLRIQLNVLGGYLYKDQASIPTELQEKYLSLCHNLLGAGLASSAAVIQDQFEKIVGSLPLQKKLKISDFEAIFWAIQSALPTSEHNPLDMFRNYILNESIADSSEIYKNLLRDTVDLLESEEVKQLTNHYINRGFAFLVDEISEYYVITEPKITEVDATSDQNGFVNPVRVEIPLAKIIPIINGLISKDKLLKLISELIQNPKGKTLGASKAE